MVAVTCSVVVNEFSDFVWIVWFLHRSFKSSYWILSNLIKGRADFLLCIVYFAPPI